MGIPGDGTCNGVPYSHTLWTYSSFTHLNKSNDICYIKYRGHVMICVLAVGDDEFGVRRRRGRGLWNHVDERELCPCDMVSWLRLRVSGLLGISGGWGHRPRSFVILIFMVIFMYC